MVIRMLAGIDRHRHLASAYQVIGHTNVIEIIHLDHYMIDPPWLRSDPERHGMVAVVAMHKHRRHGSLAHPNLVFHAAAHPQCGEKLLGRLHIALADYAMPEAAGPRLEPAMHPPPRMERL